MTKISHKESIFIMMKQDSINKSNLTDYSRIRYVYITIYLIM